MWCNNRRHRQGRQTQQRTAGSPASLLNGAPYNRGRACDESKALLASACAAQAQHAGTGAEIRRLLLRPARMRANVPRGLRLGATTAAPMQAPRMHADTPMQGPSVRRRRTILLLHARCATLCCAAAPARPQGRTTPCGRPRHTRHATRSTTQGCHETRSRHPPRSCISASRRRHSCCRNHRRWCCRRRCHGRYSPLRQPPPLPLRARMKGRIPGAAGPAHPTCG